MKREDIALTVAGIVASMALAYLLYRQQTKAALAAPDQTTVQDVTDPSYYTNQGLYDASMTYQYASQLPSLSVPTISTTSPTSSLANHVDTSASTASTGSDPGTDINNLLSQIIADYHGSYGDNTGSADFSSLAIPVIDTQPIVTTSGIPTTAADAISNAQNMIANPPGFDPMNPPVSLPIPVIDSVGGLLDTQTAATPAPSNQAPGVTTAPSTAVHNNHIRMSAQAEGY